jgi:hypothetical protein
MSDEDDYNAEINMAAATVIWRALGRVCSYLPIPIALPIDTDSLTDAIEAACRVAELADEIPMPTHQQALLCMAALAWIAGVDLTALGADTPGDYRYMAARLNLDTAQDAVIRLMQWIDQQE